jgi:glycosyltransferase involved in cell wall biosynthesis
MTTVAAIVITYNEEENIVRCLASLRWADEVIVVDSFSTDRTVELARSHGAAILSHAYDGEVPQRERGFAAAASDWVFWIDADEEVDAVLAAAIRRAVTSADADDGYEVARKASVLGKWIEHGGWFPDWQFRLARKTQIVAEYQEIHGGFTTRGTRGRLDGILRHYTYRTIAEYLRKMNDQTSLHVSNKLRDNPDLRVGWTKIVLSPVSYFLRMFFVHRGYRDGFHGFVLAAYSALYTLLMYSKTWEYQYRRRTTPSRLPPITNPEVQKLKRKYAMWPS